LTEYSSSDILGTIDYIIEKIQSLRKIMLGVSMSALILAPFAIGMSIYLMTHPTFFNMLESKDDFGVYLSILLGGIIVISVIWLFTGIRQYLSLSAWDKRYRSYIHKKEELDSSISKEYKLDEN
jgi:NADH:ubiquinone oxidoreductase subunit 5 (subunit L)/multisubunit Na+/H+ antiporter MnhA subunit